MTKTQGQAGQKPIYLDYASTTPVDARVKAKMMDYLDNSGFFGNPSSKHAFGQEAQKAVEAARIDVANCIGAGPESIIWTSGATESNNLAIKGACAFYQRKGRHIITSQIEHRSVLEVVTCLMQQGFEVTFLKPTAEGVIEPETLEKAIRDDTLLVSIQHVNNELGTYHNIARMAEITRAKDIIFHVDAAQSVGKLPIHLDKWGVDLMSLSAHKIYGPKGIGALYLCENPKARLVSLFHGSGQEKNLRSGTLPTHQIVGMGEAYRLAQTNYLSDMQRMQHLHEHFWQGIRDLPGVHLNGDPKQKIPTILNICFEHVENAKLLEMFKGLAFSSSSACNSASIETSHVLRAIGKHNEWAHRSIRFSLGRDTRIEEIDHVIACIRNGLRGDS